jgi:hypothetical protein
MRLREDRSLPALLAAKNPSSKKILRYIEKNEANLSKHDLQLLFDFSIENTDNVQEFLLNKLWDIFNYSTEPPAYTFIEGYWTRSGKSKKSRDFLQDIREETLGNDALYDCEIVDRELQLHSETIQLISNYTIAPLFHTDVQRILNNKNVSFGLKKAISNLVLMVEEIRLR